MKKSVIVLLIVVALVVLITPGIIGRLAEESIDQNLEMAVTENEDVVVSSLGFVRGWFSSEGQHRIELRNKGPLSDSVDETGKQRRIVDALVITTRIDHGLIPVTSMAREEGSLAPGLGSAVSTLSVEVSDGTSFEIPGSIYSEVSLTGELQSNFLLEADSRNVEGRLLDWGDTDVLVTSNPATGATTARGEINAFSMTAPKETIRLGMVTVDAEQRPSRFGYPLGSIGLSIDSFSVQSIHYDTTIGPMLLDSTLSAAGDRVDGTVKLEVSGFRSTVGDAEITLQARITGADGVGLGKVMSLRQYPGEPELAMAALRESEAGLEALLATGMELHFDQFDLVLPQGTMSSTLHLTVHESRPTKMSYAAFILALDGTLELGISQGLVDWITGEFPEFGGAVALGYLRKSGDLYETLVEIRSGVITINGAPMQIPLDAFQ